VQLLKTTVRNGVPEISVQSLRQAMETGLDSNVVLIDVRRTEEFSNELGHIAKARLITLGPDLTSWLKSGNREDQIIFICRSGARSEAATLESLQLGYKYTANLVGGMIRWNELKFPTEKS
jgi:rhodanese-related sulfurtransferase